MNKVYEFGGGRVKEHLGGIYDFLRAKKINNLEELEKKNPMSPIVSNTPNGASDYAAQKAEAAAQRKRQKQITETEEAIAQLEAEQTEIERKLSMPENQTAELFQKYESIKHQIGQKLYEWELLNE